MKCKQRGTAGATRRLAMRAAVGIATLSLLAACAQAPAVRSTAAVKPPAAAPTLAPTVAVPLLQLGAGDVVRLEVAGRPELSTTLYVSDDGRIPVPLAGPVSVSGKSPAQAAESVATALRAGGILLNPQVTLVLDKFQSQRISVLGAVRSPGRLPLESRTTVFDALAQAGGASEDAGDIVYLMRTAADGSVSQVPIDMRGPGDSATAPMKIVLAGGDAVYVPKAEQFYISGEVNSANMYRLEPDMTVMQAISRGGGVTPRGSENRLEIRRRGADGKLVVLDATLAERVQPGDVIRVKARLF